MAAEPRDLLIVAATVAVLGGGLFAATQGARPPALKQPIVEAPKPAAKPKAEHAPLPKIAKPKPIFAPEKRATKKKPPAKAKSRAGPSSASPTTCPWKNTGAVLECDQMRSWRAKVKRLPPPQRQACERTATLGQITKGALCGIQS